MSNSKGDENDQLHLAIYLLNKRFNHVHDFIKYWAFSGPCIEPHPAIEDCAKKS